MNKFTRVAVATIFGIGAVSAACAQDTYSTAVTLGHSTYGGDDAPELEGGTLQVETALTFGQFSLDLDIGYDRAGRDGVDLSSLSTGVVPKYWFTPQFGAGLYLARESTDLGSGDVENLDSYGLEGTYRLPAFEGSAFVGRTRVDVVADDVDVTDLGLRARMDVTPEFSVFGNAVHSIFEADGSDGTATSVGIGARYGFANGLAVFGGYQNSSAENLDGDLDTTSLGMTYGLDAGGLPVVLTAEYARIDGDSLIGSAETDRLSVGATVLFGRAQGKSVPGSAVTGNMLRSDRNAISGLLSGIGF